MGVVYLFANIAKKLQFRIEEIRAAYPDCIAYRQVGHHEKMVKIELAFRLRSGYRQRSRVSSIGLTKRTGRNGCCPPVRLKATCF
jgi:hypothetical protein